RLTSRLLCSFQHRIQKTEYKLLLLARQSLDPLHPRDALPSHHFRANRNVLHLKSLLQVLSIRLRRLTARRIGHSLRERFRADELLHCLSAHAGSARNLVVGQPESLESPAFFIPDHTVSPVLITSLRWCGRFLRHPLR